MLIQMVDFYCHIIKFYNSLLNSITPHIYISPFSASLELGFWDMPVTLVVLSALA